MHRRVPNCVVITRSCPKNRVYRRAGRGKFASPVQTRESFRASGISNGEVYHEPRATIKQEINGSAIDKRLSELSRNSVVSRELIHTSTGSVTLFAFDKNQGLSEHTTPYDALVMITDGQAEVTVSGVKHEIKAGDMLLMPASSPHALKAIEPFKMVLIMIKS